MKKVLFVATVVKMHINEFHLPYMQEFKKRGWQVDVAAQNDFVPKELINIPYCDHFYEVEFKRNPLSIRNIFAYKKIKEILTINQYDLLICNTPVGGAVARKAGSEISNLKIVYICHGFHFFKGNSLYKNLIFFSVEKFLSRYTDCILTVNEEDFEVAKKFTLRNEGNVYKINSIGCNISKVNKSNVSKSDVRRELGIEENAFVVITVAELNKNKNQRTSIEAFAKANLPNSVYLLCGCGQSEKELKEISKKLNIESRVKFLGYRNDVARLLKISDCFLFPSRREGLPMSVVEAMAAGLPLLVSDIRGIRDCVVGEKSGFLYAPNDIDGFKNGLIKVYKMNEEIRNTIKMFNVDQSKKFDINRVVKDVFTIYEEQRLI